MGCKNAGSAALNGLQKCWISRTVWAAEVRNKLHVWDAKVRDQLYAWAAKVRDQLCSRRSRRGLVQEDKRMAFVYTHGLFIT